MKADDMQRLERTKRMMSRWMCSVKLCDRKASMELLSRLNIEIVSEVVRRCRLRLFGLWNVIECQHADKLSLEV
jgi:hypothetical protein